ncbi:hypothetical protein niasHT_002890 [Heterodera trifolii]|uniref:protein-tyrosine-phosphatase n=1 Tax=Heterodera trifolii TaxID=157864 RepID=A0ABD2M703_9BILA
MTLLSHPPSSNKNATKNPSSSSAVVGTATTTTTNSSTAFPIAQIIPGCLYFTSYNIRTNDAIASTTWSSDKHFVGPPKNDTKTIYIDIDSHVHYDAFYDDFGPLNLAVLYRFCQFLHTLVLQQQNNAQQQQQQKKRLFLYTSADPQCRVNAVFLIASYMIIYHHLPAEQAYLRLQSAEPPQFVGFRDAALGPPSYLLHVQHVIKSIEKALKFKWLDFGQFDADEYEHFERVENGDLNWIVPGKLLSFCGPHARSYVENGYPYHSPEVYFDYFREHNVSSIVRLNTKLYDAKRFTDAGFAHHDLYFIDGSTPTEEIVLRFLDVVDSSPGAVAVHCKAGLGRTGCMIACWMMKHYRLTAPQCMGWLRVCRPGSVIGPQQQFLIEKQSWCWSLGKANGLLNTNRSNGLEPEEEEEEEEGEAEDGGRKLPKINGMNGAKISRPKDSNNAHQEETALNEAGQSQGDRLCEIKAHHAQLRQQHAAAAAASSKFVSPPSTSSFGTTEIAEHVQPPATVTTTPTMALPEGRKAAAAAAAISATTNGGGCFATTASSATTPIKQLKLSSTVGGGHAPAFVKINSNIGTRDHHALLAAASTASPTTTHCRRPASPTTTTTTTTTTPALEAAGTAIVTSSSRRCANKSMDMATTPTSTRTTNASTSIHSQRSKNPIAVINRLPIQKVSVSSTGRQQQQQHHTFQPHSTPSRVQLHRKHFSGTSRLKPYHPSECETAHRFATELASTAQASAQRNYGKSLKKQYSAISETYQQQKRVTALKALLSPLALPAMESGGCSGTTTTAHESANNNNHNHINSCNGGGGGTNSKYELRPRDQLHVPSRFVSEQPSLPPVIGANNWGTTNSNNFNNGISAVPSGGGGGGTSPYLLTRHQKASKSATAFFPTTTSSSRL